MPFTPIGLELKEGAEPIPGYVLQRCIGTGGYGDVWKAVAPGGLIKAMKFVHGRIEERWAERELKSLELVKRLSHPFLLSLERIEIIDGHLVIVSEMADSNLEEEFLRHRKSGKNGIPREELVGYLSEAAEVLDYLLESYSLQHLDVKPENILLVGKHVKLADFGLLRDLNESDSSIATSMTPKYASPELFGGQPSPYSDQYSLALVYCEMATGQAPFTGESPEILASQHLHASPVLDGLTASERFAIGKALSKEPERRFGSCSEFMARLKLRDTASALIGGGEGSPIPGSSSTSLCSTASPEATSGCLRPDKAESEHKHDGHTITFTSGTGRTAPALELSTKSVVHRPALFIGLGGTGGRVLCRFRQLLNDRFGKGSLPPSLQFLYIDTDSRAIEAAVDDLEHHGLQSENTLFVPLRDGWDYRNMPLGALSSICRRWLYNIPRSLRTEKIRAFGRIALLDRADSIVQCVRTAVSTATSSESAAISTERTGLAFSDGDPRVFLVTSIAGGTGGGMLVEMSYIIRQALAETGLSDEEVCGLLTYSTARGRKPPCLEAGNAYSCLEELRYFSSTEHDYPGEPACGLLGFREDRPPLRHTYLIEMDGLGTDDVYEEQVDRLARYLALNTTSSASVFFDACRAIERKHEGGGQFSMRTLGLLPLTATSSRIKPHWVDDLCRSLILKWRGMALNSVSGLSGPRLDCNDHPPSLDRAIRANGTEGMHSDQASVLDELASGLAKMVLGDFDQIMTTIKMTVSDALGQNVDDYVRDVAMKIGSECQADHNSPTMTPSAALAKINDILGVKDGASSVSENTVKSLRHTVTSEAQRLVEVGKQSMSDRLLELAEKGPGRIAGALRVAERLLSLLQATGEAANQRFQTTHLKRKQLADALARQGLRQRRKWLGRDDCQLARLAEYAHLLLEEIICEAACRMHGSLRCSGKLCQETLHDLSRLLGQIGARFQPELESADDATKADAQEKCPLFRIDSAATIFADHQEEMVEELEQDIQSHFFSAGHPLTGLLKCDSTVQRELIARMRTDAKRIILNRVESVTRTQLGALLRGADNPRMEMQLEDLLKAVTPALLHGGGAQRLALLGPSDEILGPLQERIAKVAGQDINVVATSEGEVVLCCEAEEIRFESVAAGLMRSQPDCKELAARLHTRVDVRW